MDLKKIEQYKFLQDVLEIAKEDKAKAMQVLSGIRTTALNKGDPLFARRVEEWMRLI